MKTHEKHDQTNGKRARHRTLIGGGGRKFPGPRIGSELIAVAGRILAAHRAKKSTADKRRAARRTAAASVGHFSTATICACILPPTAPDPNRRAIVCAMKSVAVPRLEPSRASISLRSDVPSLCAIVWSRVDAAHQRA